MNITSFTKYIHKRTDKIAAQYQNPREGRNALLGALGKGRVKEGLDEFRTRATEELVGNKTRQEAKLLKIKEVAKTMATETSLKIKDKPKGPVHKSLQEMMHEEPDYIPGRGTNQAPTLTRAEYLSQLPAKRLNALMEYYTPEKGYPANIARIYSDEQQRRIDGPKKEMLQRSSTNRTTFATPPSVRRTANDLDAPVRMPALKEEVARYPVYYKGHPALDETDRYSLKGYDEAFNKEVTVDPRSAFSIDGIAKLNAQSSRESLHERAQSTTPSSGSSSATASRRGSLTSSITTPDLSQPTTPGTSTPDLGLSLHNMPSSASNILHASTALLSAPPKTRKAKRLSTVGENSSKEIEQALNLPKTSRHKRGHSEPDAKLLKKSEWFSPFVGFRLQRPRLVTTKYVPAESRIKAKNTQSPRSLDGTKRLSWSGSWPSKPVSV